MEISEYRERMREYVVGDKFRLDDEQWWDEVTDLALLVLAERTRVKRERAQANPVYRAWKERQVSPGVVSIQPCLTSPTREESAVVKTTSDGAPRCPVMHNPGLWPYISRCVRDASHPDDHIDRHGILWTNGNEGDERE